MQSRTRILVTTLLLAGAAAAEELPSPAAVQQACGGPTRGVTVLRNAEGAVGGYVAVPAVMDAPVTYYDAAGQYLTMFHIFDSDTGKAAAARIVQKLRSEFPREDFVPCPLPVR